MKKIFAFLSFTEVIGVMSKNLDLYQSAGSEDINNTLTKEMVEQELQRYYDYHPEKYDEFIKKYKTFDNIVEKLYIKRTKIRRRKNRLARIVSCQLFIWLKQTWVSFMKVSFRRWSTVNEKAVVWVV